MIKDKSKEMVSESKQIEPVDYKSDYEDHDTNDEKSDNSVGIIDGQKRCNRCKVLLPYSSFRMNRRGNLYKSCISCESTRNSYRNTQPPQRIDEVVNNLRRQYNEQQLSVEQLFDKLNDAFTQLDELREALEATQRRLDNFEELDENGYVYAKEAPPNVRRTRTLLIKAIPNIFESEFFKMKPLPMMDVEEFNKRKQRRTLSIAIGKHLNSMFKRDHGRSSFRTKSKRTENELADGESSTGCLFPEDYWKHIKPYIISKGIDIGYLMGREPQWTPIND